MYHSFDTKKYILRQTRYDCICKIENIGRGDRQPLQISLSVLKLEYLAKQGKRVAASLVFHFSTIN